MFILNSRLQLVCKTKNLNIAQFVFVDDIVSIVNALRLSADFRKFCIATVRTVLNKRESFRVIAIEIKPHKEVIQLLKVIQQNCKKIYRKVA